MSHLSIERLAALADEQPTSDEQIHLAQCAICTREVEAHRSLLSLAGTERAATELPLTQWETLSHRLRAEGLITAKPDVRYRIGLHRARFNSRAMLQIAAALLLVAGGSVLGRLSAGATPVPGGLTGSTAESTETAMRGLPLDSLPTAFASVDEAVRWRNFYSSGYQQAVSYLAANDSAGRAAETPAVMRTRLSALDQVSRTMREALADAPHDPVINDFYLNSFGQREATLRQLNTVLPQGVRLNSF